MSVRRTSLKLFYDVISPYSWIGFELSQRYQPKWNFDLELVPVLFGGILALADNIGPGAHPVKAKLLRDDVIWLGKYYNIPIVPPKDFKESLVKKRSTLTAQRLLTVVKQNSPDHLIDLSRALFLRLWHKDDDITQNSTLLQACTAAGISTSDAEKFLGRVADQDVKDTLRARTKQAFDYGTYGVPTFVFNDADGQQRVVYGSDRMNVIALLLKKNYEGPLNEDGVDFRRLVT